MTAATPALRHSLNRAARFVWAGLRVSVDEVWWWVSGAGRFLWRAPGKALAWTVGLVWSALTETWAVLAVVLGLAAVPALWARCWPGSYERHVAHPGWRRRVRRSVRRSWAGLMDAAGLSRRVVGRNGPETRVPGLYRIGWQDPDVLVVVPQLMVGQTVDDIVHVSERLRTTVGSRQVRVIPNDAHTGCTLRFLFADPLAQVIEARFPSPNLAPTLTTAQMGITENGEPWLLPVQVHTLTAASSGAGKASAMWMLMLSLAPAIRAGVVQVHGIDLKGGVEHALGARLFTRRASSLAEAVVLLEDAVDTMLTRARGMAGHTRTHVPTPGAPLVIVVIDELAMLTAYSTDRDLLKRADTALRSLLALGRAPGFIVYGYVQDPRKDTVPQRHLFNQTVALRLREREEVVMVLSEGAVAAGAACHKIPRSSPGIGYVLAENGDVTRVRVAHVTDDMVRALAAHFSAPVQIPLTLPVAEPAPEKPVRAPRKPRTPRAPREDSAS